MDRSSSYYKQVQLLIQLLPLIAEEDCFALKGGTAINLFIRELPRLSVDIDLVYLPMNTRSDALAEIRDALTRISENIEPLAKLSQIAKLQASYYLCLIFRRFAP